MCQQPRNQIIDMFSVVCAVFTGVRRSELVRVTRRDVDLEEGTIRFRLMKGRGNRAFKPYTVPMTPEFQQFIEQYLSSIPDNLQCIFCDNDGHLLEGGLQADERNTTTKANRPGKLLRHALEGTEFEPVSGFHIHRHSPASLLKTSGYDKEFCMEFFSHRTERVSLGYQHSERSKKIEQKRKAVAAVMPNAGLQKPTGCRSAGTQNRRPNENKVGTTRFELATSAPPVQRSTRLSHVPLMPTISGCCLVAICRHLLLFATAEFRSGPIFSFSPD